MDSTIDNSSESQLLALINQCEPGQLPLSLFNSLAKLVVISVIEVVVYSDVGSVDNVLLLKRSDDDEFWPNQYSVPGKIMSPGDIRYSFPQIVVSICENYGCEIGHNIPEVVSFQLVETKRGVEFVLLYKIKAINTKSAKGEYYATNDLPLSILTEHRGFIGKAFDKNIAR